MSDGLTGDEPGATGNLGAVDPLTGQIVAPPAADEGVVVPPVVDDGSADPDWYQNISAESGEDGSPALRDWLKSAGIKDIDGLAKVARDNQKALRESGRIKIPGEGATETEVAEYRKALGVPEDPSGYTIPVLKDADGNDFVAPNGEPLQLDEVLLSTIFASAHKHGGSKAVVDGIVADFVAAQRAEMDSGIKQLQDDTNTALAEWGPKKAENLAAGHRAIRALGLSDAEVTGLKVAPGWSASRALNVLATLGAGLSEDQLLTGGQRRFGASGAEAQATLNTKRADAAWVAKAVQPGTPENAEHDRLVDAIAAEANRQRQAA